MNIYNLLLISFLTTLVSCLNNPSTDIQRHSLFELRGAQQAYENSFRKMVFGQVKKGQGLFQAMMDLGLTNVQSLDVINNLRDEVEFSKLKVGNKIGASFNYKNELIQFSYNSNSVEKHVLNKINSKWIYQFVEEETIWQARYIDGKLNKNSTLQADLLSEGISRSVVGQIVDVLLCKVHFRLDARAGDEYKVLISERLYHGEILETKILYTSYKGERTGHHEAYFYEEDDKSTYTAHYTKEGEALIRSGLRYPVKKLHIRSGYGKRRHPVTGKYKMHRGVDLRGKIGAPVYAVAKGKVIESKFTKLGGNKIVIRHADKSKSYYLHLNKRFVKKGQVVKPHQKIGQIGKTGRVTGPHLHFGFRNAKGRWMNPMHKRMIATPKLKGDRLAKLKKTITKTDNILKNVVNKRLTQNRLPANSRTSFKTPSS